MIISKISEIIVGIVTYNSRDDIDACLERLQEQTYLSFDVTLFDNASSDGTADWLETHWPQHRLIRSEENIGFGNAHNRIIAATESKYYLALNPDAILMPDYIEEMVKTIESEAQVGWVAGKLYFFKDETEIGNSDIEKIIYTSGHAVFRDGFAINIGCKRPDNKRYQEKHEVFGANAAAPLYRRAMLEDIQFKDGEYFDEAIFLYHEDVDLDWRARLLGWRCLFTPDAVGYHAQGASGGTSVRSIMFAITATRYYSIFKHAFLFDLLTYNIPAFILHSLFMLLTQPQRGLATIRYIFERLGHIRRKRKWLASHRKISRQELQAWYAWSSQQGQEQSYNYFARFWRGRILRKPVSEG
jgi:GT2 family glycosyltransferase